MGDEAWVSGVKVWLLCVDWSLQLGSWLGFTLILLGLEGKDAEFAYASFTMLLGRWKKMLGKKIIANKRAKKALLPKVRLKLIGKAMLKMLG